MQRHEHREDFIIGNGEPWQERGGFVSVCEWCPLWLSWFAGLLVWALVVDVWTEWGTEGKS